MENPETVVHIYSGWQGEEPVRSGAPPWHLDQGWGLGCSLELLLFDLLTASSDFENLVFQDIRKSEVWQCAPLIRVTPNLHL